MTMFQQFSYKKYNHFHKPNQLVFALHTQREKKHLQDQTEFFHRVKVLDNGTISLRVSFSLVGYM